MQTNSGNVVALSQFDRGRRGMSSNEALVLLTECREQFSAAIAQAWHDRRDAIEMRLLHEGEHTPILENRSLYFSAQKVLRTRYESLLTAFRQQLTRRFDKLTNPDNKPEAGAGKPSFDELSLMDESTFEISLAVSRVASRLQALAVESLAALDQRLMFLAQSLQVKLIDSPIAPRGLAECFLDACAGIDSDTRIQLVLLQQFDEEIVPLLPAMFESLNRFLLSNEVLPAIKIGVSSRQLSDKPDVRTGHSGQDQAYPTDGQAKSSMDGAADVLALLQQLLARQGGSILGGGGAFGVSGGEGGVSFAPATAALGSMRSAGGDVSGSPESINSMALLTRLQRGQLPAGLSAAMTTERLESGQVNMLRDIRAAGLVNTGNRTDELVIDIVAMLFDFVFNEDEIPVEMKALIGRLQIPMLKVAMLDRQFFSRKTHPARLLLDEIAHMAMGWTREGDANHQIYDALKGVVDTITNEFTDDLSIFSDLLTGLQGFSANAQAEVEQQVEKTAQELETIERAGQAEAFAQRAVDQVIARARLRLDCPLPDGIVAFVNQTWQKVLMEIYTREGANTEPLNQAIHIAEQLLWSVTPKIRADERLKLVAMLPALLRGLREGMDKIGVEQEQRDLIFSELVACHSNAVRPVQNGPDHQNKQDNSAGLNGGGQQNQKDTQSNTMTSIGFADVLTQVATKPLPAARFAEQISRRYGVAGAELADKQQDTFTELVKGLHKGVWLELTTLGDDRRQMRLAWVSDLRGIYLFTNSLGLEPLTMTQSRLASLLRKGDAKVIDPGSLTERAVDNVISRLQSANFG